MLTDNKLAELGMPLSSYFPQQNGLADEMNKILLSRVKKMAKPFEEYNYLSSLAFIFKQGAYLANQSPPRNRDTIPQIAYHGTVADAKSHMPLGIDAITLMSGPAESAHCWRGLRQKSVI